MLKRILIFLSVIAIALLLYSVFVENVFAPRLSPKDSAVIELNDLKLKVEYNRPSKRERVVFGALVPFDKVWRTGANEATTFKTNRDLIIQGMLLPKGNYTLWTVPMEKSWKVMSVEKFTIAFDNTTGDLKLTLAWDNTMIAIPIEQAALEKTTFSKPIS